MNKILVPIDYSDTSLNALSYAIRLFESQSLEITILHTYSVIRASAFSMKIKSIDRVMKEDAEREIENLIMRLEKEEPDVIFKSKLVNSSATSAITQLGDSGNYDFIVMGTKGASGLKEVFIGSVAGWVISKTKAPVVIVPKNHQYRPLKEIVFAISDHPLSNNSVVEPLTELFKMHSCNVNVLHIMNNHNPIPDELMNAIDHMNPMVTYISGGIDINKSLIDFMDDSDADLLCLIRSKKGFFSHLFVESVTLKQSFRSTVPLLILHDA